VIAGVVAATVAAPGYSTTIEQSAVDHWKRAMGGERAALRVLVGGAWIEGEAKERKVVVSRKDAEDAVDRKPADGLTRRDFVYVARLTLLRANIEEQITQPAAQSVTPAQVDEYVQTHPRMEPERRRVRIVLAKTRKVARLVERKLAHGLTWKLAARRYSLIGGLGPKTIEPGDQDEDVERAIFGAQPKRLMRYRAWVFKVVKVLPAHPTPLATQRAAAWEILASEAEQEALDEFRMNFAIKWRARTTCASAYAREPECAQPQQVERGP